ncbi:hypothetical protein BABINDRAFT_162010 [Babjeviella inositovora NRRL Y-12698]|uniref:Eukaryotic translation initiation factor 3 subunit I n=1 Tax=Babjeviella inositovora NRRL Y-12698 TaxID=984486 RepID=A0A1E3QPQ1_9ASCO|nr:uncharacterized protein BABINDRAFT_162010 [Babjeviella inositovora NRRL Y-12698]ODQ79630.1 hypothetical protein BABINDRAFT_162010 [Babjeviella inositovora NRRL Y-12698]
MRPLMLKGHERSLTQVKYNKEGDLIFSVAKDKVASIWYSSNGERVGTLGGVGNPDSHIGTIWSIDVDIKTNYAVTGSADFSAKLWRVQGGACLHTWKTNTPVRRVAFSPDNSKLIVVTAETMGFKGAISVYPINYTSTDQSDEPLLTIETREGASVVTVAGWAYNGKYIIAGHNDGTVSKYDAETGEFLADVRPHELNITDLQFADDLTYFLVSSKDKSASLIDVDTLTVRKVFEADAPMNSAAFTPVKDFVILGGGQEARDVTTTSSRQGKFEARFFHKIFQDEIGRVKGHFGPLNYVAVHPAGTSYASGGEDGYIRVHHFEKSYFDFKYDVERTAEAQHQKISA